MTRGTPPSTAGSPKRPSTQESSQRPNNTRSSNDSRKTADTTDGSIDAFFGGGKSVLSKGRGFVRKHVVHSMKFKGTVGLLIAAYAITIGISADSDDPDASHWVMLETAFACCFSIEIAIRIYADGWRRYIQDHWSKFDIILVGLQWIDILASAASLKTLAVLRALRILRLMEVVATIPVFRELWILVNGMMESARATVWVAALLALLLYVFGVIFAALVPLEGIDYYNEWGWNGQTYWGSVGKSMFTLFQVVTLDDWSSNIARPLVMQSSPVKAIGFGLMFIAFIMLTSYTIMQQLLGAMCESAQVCAKENDAHTLKVRAEQNARIVKALKAVFLATDTDGSGALDRREVKSSLKDKHVRRLLRHIDIQGQDMVDLFTMMDEAQGKSDGIDVDEFLKRCQLLKGDARGRDLISVSATVQAAVPRFERSHLASAERQVHLLRTAGDSVDRLYITMRRVAHKKGRAEFTKAELNKIDSIPLEMLGSRPNNHIQRKSIATVGHFYRRCLTDPTDPSVVSNQGSLGAEEASGPTELGPTAELRRIASIASTMRTHHLVRVWGYVPDMGPLFYPNSILRRQFSDSELLGSPVERGISDRFRGYSLENRNVDRVINKPEEWMWWSPVEGTEGGNRGFVERIEEHLEKGHLPELQLVVEEDKQSITAQPKAVAGSAAMASHRPKKFMEAGGIRSSIFNLTTATLGAGALSLPYAFRNSGYIVGSLCLLVCAFLSYTSIGYIQVCMDVSRCQTFEKLAFSCSPNPSRGRRLALLAIISVITFCFGTAVGYLITLGQIGYTIGCALLSLPTAVEGSHGSSGTNIMLCALVIVILYPLCLAEKVNELRIPSLIGVMSVFLLVFVIIFEAIVGGHHSQENSLPMLPAYGWPGVVRTMSLVTFAFACQPNVPAIYAELKESETKRRCRATRMRSVAFWAVLICLLVYFGVGFAGVYTWGVETRDNILYNYNALFKGSFDITLAFIGMSIAIIAAYPLCIFPARFGLESALLVLYPSRFDPDDSGRASRTVVTLLTAITVLLSLGCAILAPSMAQVFELVGSTSGALTCYILPSYFYICLVTGNHMTLECLKAWGVMLIGIVFAFIGTAVAITGMT
ncbi:hypothetical protein FOL47_007027, partial [Perkinsus chesapeaki]